MNKSHNNGSSFLKGSEVNGELLTNIEDKMELITFLLDTLDSFFKRSPEILENLNRDVIWLREKLKDKKDVQALSSLMEFVFSTEFSVLIEGIRKAYVESKENDYRTSITGIVRALTDEDIQRALAFILLALKYIGQTLGKKEL